jgi:hypothetical protein
MLSVYSPEVLEGTYQVIERFSVKHLVSNPAYFSPLDTAPRGTTYRQQQIYECQDEGGGHCLDHNRGQGLSA